MPNGEAGRIPIATICGSALLVWVIVLGGLTPVPAQGQSAPPAPSNVRVVAAGTDNAPDVAAVVKGIRPRGFGSAAYVPLQPSPGRTMYLVAQAGSDTNTGTPDAPFRTINKAAQVASAGDVVTIRDGAYSESVMVRNAGTAASPIVFQAENRGGVVLTGGQYNFQPAGWTGGKIAGNGYVTVRGLVFREYSSLSAGQAALRGVTGWRIEDCLFDSPGRDGLDLRGDFIVLTKTTIQSAFQHAFVAWGPANQATAPTDPTFEGIRDLQVTDVILRANFSPRMEVQSAASASSVAKILGSKNALIDNIESSENNGPGLWFDGSNFGYVVRNSYFHDNRHLGSGYSPGRGLHLEIGWSPGLVENDVFTNNSHEGLAISNSAGVTVRRNFFYGNRRQIVLSNMDRGAAFPLRDVRMEYNFFKDWREYGAIEPLGNIPAGGLASMQIVANFNVYDPVRSSWLSGWWGSTIGAITTIGGMRAHLGWEQNGLVGAIPSPQTN
jgi:hypothetical protein